MKVKCWYCDKTGKKSLDKNSQDYVKKDGKNYHTECYKQMLKNKGIIELEIELEIKKLKQQMIEHEKEIELKNKPKNELCYWLMDFYNIDVLPTGFYHRLASITKGEYVKAKISISYEELLEIYKKMANYLNKAAMKKGGFDNESGRLYWDLAIVINNYNDYKKWKHNQSLEKVENKKIDKLIKDDMKIKHVIRKENSNNFNIMEEMNDLLL